MNDLREKLAAMCHDQWKGWMRYIFFNCDPDRPRGWDTGNSIIPRWAVERWTRQMDTDYKDLPEDEKESDRTEADKFIKLLKDNSGEISDGYHTFNELYQHRIVLFIKLCEYYKWSMVSDPMYDKNPIWRSQKHSDGTSYDGWFIMGINKEKGEQISYHIPIDKWDETDFADTLDKAPEYDGHTSNDVIDRLLKL